MAYEEKILNSFIGEEDSEGDTEELSGDLPEADPEDIETEDDDDSGLEDVTL